MEQFVVGNTGQWVMLRKEIGAMAVHLKNNTGFGLRITTNHYTSASKARALLPIGLQVKAVPFGINVHACTCTLT